MSIGTPMKRYFTGVYQFEDVQIYDNLYSIMYKLHTDNLDNYINLSIFQELSSPNMIVLPFYTKGIPDDKDDEGIAPLEDNVDDVNEDDTDENVPNLDDLDVVLILYYDSFRLKTGGRIDR